MNRWIIKILLLCVLCAPLAPAQTSRGRQAIPEGANEEDIYKIIKKDRDLVAYDAFDRLAKLGTAKALDKLQDAVEHVVSPYTLRRAYLSFRFFRGKPELENQAWQFVVSQTSKASNQVERYAAVSSMLTWEDQAAPTLKSILLNHQDPACRTLACNALIPFLGEQGDAEAAKLILQNATLKNLRVTYLGGGPRAKALINYPSKEGERPIRRSHREVVRVSLLQCQGPRLLDAMFHKLGDEDCPSNWKFLLIELLGELADEDISPRLASLLRDSDLAVVALTIDTLSKRGDWDSLERRLRGFLKSKDTVLQRAAVVALGRLHLQDKKWSKQLRKYAESKKIGLQLGAAVALAELHTTEAIELLHGLLDAPEWRVRAEAVQQIGNLRRKQSIPILISRLDRERGRLQGEIAYVLRLVSGKNLGLTTGAWSWWWQEEGEAFVIPTLAEALAAEDRRQSQNTGNRTGASFYGLQVISERVCFILDTSGSMSAAAVSQVRNTAADGKKKSTRIEVAKQQLSRIIKQLADDRMFNIIFFESRVKAWADELTKMEDRSRKDALSFIKEQRAAGGTALYDALELAFADPLIDTIFILSDGVPSGGKIIDVNQIRSIVARWNQARKVKINGIAIGMQSQLLRWLADDSGGLYHFEP